MYQGARRVVGAGDGVQRGVFLLGVTVLQGKDFGVLFFTAVPPGIAIEITKTTSLFH